jgi:hypothetical protein
VRATAAGTTRVNRTDYGDARISVAPVVAVMFTTAKDLVLVDGASGTERTIAHQVDYLQAMSDDGTRALAVVNSHASSIELGGTVHPFGADLTYGLIADEDTGWSADGAFTIARGTGGLKIDDGARQRVWKLPAGDVSHLSIAPDGKRVAFLGTHRAVRRRGRGHREEARDRRAPASLRDRVSQRSVLGGGSPQGYWLALSLAGAVASCLDRREQLAELGLVDDLGSLIG